MLSTIAFGVGIISAGIQMVFQGLRVALAGVDLHVKSIHVDHTEEGGARGHD